MSARPSRLQKEIERGTPVTYNDYARWRGVVPGEPTAPATSPLIEWREQAQDIRLHGSKCRACGTVQRHFSCGRLPWRAFSERVR